MKPSQSDAIADFIAQGGRVLKVSAAIPATVQDVLVYPASCGVSVKYIPGTRVPTLAEGGDTTAPGCSDSPTNTAGYNSFRR